MNIFYTDHCPITSARNLCNKHLSKMLIECGQIGATGVRFFGATDLDLISAGVVTSKGTAWRSTHINHPSTVWARTTRSNFLWLLDHADEIAQEYTRRYGRVHACQAPIKALRSLAFMIPEGDLTEVALAMPDHHKIVGDPVGSYRSYYHTKEFAVWTDADPPDWWMGI